MVVMVLLLLLLLLLMLLRLLLMLMLLLLMVMPPENHNLDLHLDEVDTGVVAVACGLRMGQAIKLPGLRIDMKLSKLLHSL